MMFFIPVIIILGVLIMGLGGSVFKDLGIDLAIPDVSKYLTPQTKSSSQKAAPIQGSSKSQVYTQTQLSPRAPPPAQTQPEEKPTVSPWIDKITISSFSKPEGVRKFRATLSVNLNSSSTVSLTGWRLKSKFFGETTIGLGIEKYHPSLNSQPTENIILRSSDVVYISGDPSPFGRGIHFRTNSCFGYLKPYYPSLPGTSSCSQDKPRIEEISHLNPGCQEFILNQMDFYSCKSPDLSPISANTECIAYINSTTNGFNYGGCYARRNNETNFLSREWYIYTDTQLGHFLHDTITLYDQNGLVVDIYIY